MAHIFSNHCKISLKNYPTKKDTVLAMVLFDTVLILSLYYKSYNVFLVGWMEYMKYCI